MATLDELKRRNQQLRNKRKAIEEMKKIDRQRKKLEKENYLLTHPKISKALTTSKSLGSKFSSFAKNYASNYGTTTTKSKTKKPQQNLGWYNAFS